MSRFANTLTAIVVVFCQTQYCQADTFGTGENRFEIEFVTIGNPGKPADSSRSVDYEYRIGKHEISRDMVSKANDEGGLELTLYGMNSVTGGPRPNMPATGLNWNEAARFTNWLNISEGFHPAYAFDAQPGEAGYHASADIVLWDHRDAGYDSSNPFRNRLARYFLPSADEWYKAAFYDPDANGGAGGFWDYATGSNSPPAPVASGTDPGTAVYLQEPRQGPADITQAGGLSPYEVMGMVGNVSEWQESAESGENLDGASERSVHGGSWSSRGNSGLHREDGHEQEPAHKDLNYGGIGFRIASVPEPSLIGDYNIDGVLDAADVDLQAAEMKKPPAEQDLTMFDHNSDGMINVGEAGADESKWGDRLMWIRTLRGTAVGDTNMDGIFDSGDLILAFQGIKYGSGEMATWVQGDWNGDMQFDSGDLILAFQDGQYVAAEAPVVPEPASHVMLIACVIGLAAFPRIRMGV